MERLTYFRGGCWWVKLGGCEYGGYPETDRLAAYEDTGMTPKEINHILDAYGRGLTLRTDVGERLEIVKEFSTERLKELDQAEKDGRLVVLPCKVRDNDDGLKAKYIVYKAETGEEVNNCFVLRPDRDAAAVTAIRAYAAVTGNKTLDADLIRWVGVELNNPLTLEELLEMDGEPAYFQFGDGAKGWAIVEKDMDDIVLYGSDFDDHTYPDSDFINMEYNDPDGHFGLHVLGWRAYRHKPEEGTT